MSCDDPKPTKPGTFPDGTPFGTAHTDAPENPVPDVAPRRLVDSPSDPPPRTPPGAPHPTIDPGVVEKRHEPHGDAAPTKHGGQHVPAEGPHTAPFGGRHDPDPDRLAVEPPKRARGPLMAKNPRFEPQARVVVDSPGSPPVTAAAHSPSAKAPYPHDVSPKQHSPEVSAKGGRDGAHRPDPLAIAVDPGVSGGPHVPQDAVGDPPVPPKVHSPSPDGAQPSIAARTHDPDQSAESPVAGGTHDPDTSARSPLAGGQHVPAPPARPQVEPSSHIPDHSAESPLEGKLHEPPTGATSPVAGGTHDPDTSAQSAVEEKVHAPDPDADSPVAGGTHDPDPSADSPVAGGTHEPDPDAESPVAGGTHDPDPGAESPVAGGMHDPDIDGIDPGEFARHVLPPEPDGLPLSPRAPGGELDPSDDVNRAANRQVDDPKKLRDPFDELGGSGGPGTRVLDPLLYAKQVESAARALGVGGVAKFAVEQAALFALNSQPETRIWDPMYPVNRAPLLNRSRTVFLSTSAVDDKPGVHERRVEADTGGRHDTVRQMLDANGPLGMNARVVTSYEPPFARAEGGVMVAGPHQRLLRSSQRTIGAPSQDDSLVPAAIAIDPTRVGRLPGDSLLDVALSMKNSFTPDDIFTQDGTQRTQTYAGEFVDIAVDGAAAGSAQVGAAYAEESFGGVKRKRFRPLGHVFEDRGAQLGQLPKSPRVTRRDPIEKSAFSDGIVPMEFAGERGRGMNGKTDGSVVTTNPGERPSDIITDDDAYVPLSFTDLRPLPGNPGSLRTVYFRPIITSLVEDFAPEWSEEGFYGRVDPVLVYKSTTRSVTFSFELHAFAPEDLVVIYRKLNWLASMVYPEYDGELLLRAGPVCRLRIGDIVKSRGMGLPGAIKSLNYDYTDSLWELKAGSKAPRSVRVSVNFLALHDVIIGRGKSGVFGGIGFVNSDGEYTSAPTTMRALTGESSGGSKVGGFVMDKNESVEVADAFRGFGSLLGDDK